MVNVGLFDPYDVTVVLMANGNRANGGLRSRFRRTDATIASGKTKVIDIAMEYDGLSDYPVNSRNLLACLNAYLGYLTIHGGSMKKVDFDTAVRGLGVEYGSTTYVSVPHPSGMIPLVRLFLGLRFVPKRWRSRLRTSIESRVEVGYDRSRIGQDVKFRH